MSKKSVALLMLIAVFCVNQNSSAQSSLQNHSNSAIKIALQSFSFNKLLNAKIKGKSKGMSVSELLDFSAENNFDAVDILSYYFPGYPEVPKDSVIYSIKKKAFQLGLEISGTGVRTDFTNPNPEIRKKSIKHLKDWVDVAVKLGAPVVRFFLGNIPKGYEYKWETIAAYVVPNIKECVDYAKGKGILIAVQNHGGFLNSADETIKLVKRVDSDYFGAIVDTGYFSAKDPYSDMEQVMPYAFNFLLKESTNPKDLSVGIDLKRVMEIIDKSGFRGYVQLEALSPKKAAKGSKIKTVYDPYISVPKFLKNVQIAVSNEYKK